MKVAICMSGLSRNIAKAWPNIRDFIIVPNNADVFVHTWGGEGYLRWQEGNRPIPLEPEQQLVFDLYKPKVMVVEKQEAFRNSRLDMDRMMASHARPFTRENFLQITYCMWYSIQQANHLKEQYRLYNDIDYAYVIRARLDINYTKVLPCYQYDNSVIHIPNKELPPEMIDDRFAFGPNYLMNIYSSGFNFLDYVNGIRSKADGIFCGETLLFELSKKIGIPFRVIPDLHCPHVTHYS